MRLLQLRKIILLALLCVTASAAMAGMEEYMATSKCLLCRVQSAYNKATLTAFSPGDARRKSKKIKNYYFTTPQAFAPKAEGFNTHELGVKAIYFGIALGVNVSDFVLSRKPYTVGDPIKTITTGLGPGFNLGIIGNWQFHRYFDLRLIPSLVFSDKNIEYQTTFKGQSVVRQSVSSIYLDFPLQVRFKSDPIKDFRLYVIGGIRYDFDLASNQNSKAKDIIKVRKFDLCAEYGIGFMLYFPYFIMSPEFKMSHGFININSTTPGYIYSTTIDKLYSRSFTFTINLEG